MPTSIVLPSSLETFRCNVPGCEEEFLHKSAYLRHVPRCAKRFRSRLIDLSEAHAAEVDADPFQRVWDPEALTWVQRRNKEGKKIS